MKYWGMRRTESNMMIIQIRKCINDSLIMKEKIIINKKIIRMTLIDPKYIRH